ncbi:transient receptor potential cation channel protein painless-like [Sitodiplosis mosellana]|uniref:transient receptor potential cation channel protein painless-like n=1 Tax=Sitodiplosis mosellana TaxID=263140 RepID=UPI0024447DF6|nr:transient receptor potential cation channel protein painless-like [Sitodiplosis mosellana]
MNGINEAVYLEDLRSFRWELYHRGKCTERIQCLTRYYCKKYNFQHFAEEIVIAGVDLQNLNADVRQEVYLRIPNLSYDEFPSILEKEDSLWDANRLFICLLYANDECFVKGVRLIAEKRPTDIYNVLMCTRCILWQLKTWLHPSVYGTFVLATEKFHASNSFRMEPLLEKLKTFENDIQHWKDRKFSNVVDLLDALLPDPKFRHKKLTEYFNQEQCVETLIDWDVDIAYRFHQNHTALYYAVARNESKIILKLLQKGSFIGSAPLDLHVGCSNLKVLQEHFNDCITKCVDDDRFIEIDLKNLFSSPNSSDRPCDVCVDEMNAIEMIGECCEHKHLLVHPVIAIFVLLKWNQMAFLNDVSGSVKMVLAVGTIGMTSYVAVRRLVYQIYYVFYRELNFCDKIYNYLKCAIDSTTVILIMLFFLVNSPTIRPILAAGCVVSIACELFILSGSLFWSFSKYYVMFLYIARSCLRSCQLFLILLPAFTFSFHLLLRRDSLKHFDQSEMNGKEIDYQFSNVRSTVVKVVAMLVGELENGGSNFDSTVLSSFLYTAFVFLITIVFMNMMNGLAVSNIQKLQANAELSSMRQRVKLLSQFEGIVSNELQNNRKYHNKLIEKLFKYFAKINTLDILHWPSKTKIYIGPDNGILVLRKDYKTAEQESIEFHKNGSYLHSWTSHLFCSHKHLRVHPKVVHEARRIIEMKESKQREQNEKNQLKNRIVNIENTLNEIKQMIQQNAEIAKQHLTYNTAQI